MPESTIPALLGRYRPQHVIGRGGEASIFKATDELLGREVAIKLYRSGGEEEMAQYRTEQAALARLSHHGIVSLIDAGIDYTSPKDPRPFLIMELVSGTDLAATLDQRELSLEEEGAARARLARDHGLDARAADNLLRYLADQRAATGEVPSDRAIRRTARSRIGAAAPGVIAGIANNATAQTAMIPTDSR